jgi:TATA-binding protein-associated factor
MGLGKTLQSICMLSADHHLRAEKYRLTQAPDCTPTPSLVVVPSTLTHHWFCEIEKYAPFMRHVIYTGSASERAMLLAKAQTYDVIILSYEMLRKDIGSLGQLEYNYCILDEGHVIRNAKTKQTKAVKYIKAMKRLILSGTPIQNNVLELWSLFDFLMPGFLGTERQFNDKFGKPIAASKDAKSSSKEQEAGTLALEALHRQVLPFILRRMKEDVLHDLPPKIIQDYECRLSQVQQILYDDFMRSQYGGIESDMKSEDSVKMAKGSQTFQAMQYLRKLINHPSLVLTKKHPKYEAVMQKVKEDGGELSDITYAPKIVALK